MRSILPAILLIALSAAAQPVITYRGVFNAGSLAPSGLPHSGIPRGGVFTIFGSNLGPTTPATVSAFPLTPSFEGVTISVTQGGVSASAIPIFVSANQINAIMPSSAPSGIVSIRVGFGNRISPPITVEVVDNAPGLFAISSGGFGPGVIQNFVSEANQPVNSLDTPATRGQAVTIWATGLGRVPFPDNIAPTVQNLDIPISVTIGEREAPRLYAGRSGCCAGVDQIVVRVPEDAPLGCYVPVRVRAANGVSNTVTMAIAANANTPCADSFNPFTNLLRSRRQGMMFLDRTLHLVDSYITTAEQNTTESARAYFTNREPSPFTFDPQVSYPPPGSCLVQQASGNVLRGAPLRGTPPPSAALDAGNTLRLVTTTGPVDIPRTTSPQVGYSATLGSLRPADGVGILKLDFTNAAAINISGPLGTASIQPNSTSLFAWAGRPALDRIRRDVPLRLPFTPNDFNATSELSIVAYSAVHNATTAVTCLAAPGVDTFQVPTDVLALLPPSTSRPDGSLAMLGIGIVPLTRAVPFNLLGIESGLLLFTQWQTRSVYVQ
jgi:uncharacterized protein (TIGR03437 family)